MAQGNAFGHLIPGQPPANVPSGSPVGDPIVKPRDPYKETAEQRAKNAEGRAQEDQALQRQKFELDKQKLATDQAKVSVEQGKAGAFALRARDALSAYDKAGLDPDSMIGQWGNQNLPNVTAGVSSDQRNAVRGAEREFIAAVLRYDSGAAIPPAEFQSAYLTYFPTSNAGPEEIAQKKRARETALQGLMLGAGPAADKMPPPQPASSPGSGGGATPISRDESIAIWGKLYLDENGNPLGPDGGVGIDPETGQRKLISRVTDSEEADAKDADFWQQVDRLAKERNTFFGELDASMRGAADVLSVGLADKASAAANTIFSGGTYADNLRQERISNEADKRANPIMRGLGQFGGALMLPNAATLGRNALLGAGYGGAYGFNTSDEPFSQRGDNALIGGGLGAAGAVGGQLAGQAVGRGYNALSRDSAAAREVAENADVIAAGQRQGIAIRQPDVRPSTRADFAAVEASPTGNPIVTRALEGDRKDVQNRLQEIGGQGQVRDNFSTGEAIQNAGQRYIARTRTQANALYTRAEQAVGNVSAPPTKAIATIDRHIAELTQNGERTNAGQIRYLEDLKADLQSGTLTIQKLRAARTNMRGQLNERSLTGTDAERRVGEVIDAASDDIADALQGNPKALGAYKTADSFYRQKQDFIQQVVQKFTGSRNNPISAEQAATRLNAMMKEGGDSARFSRMWKELESDERADLQATFAEALGKGRGGDFSLAALATNMRKINGKTAREVFGDDGLAALRDLQVIAKAKTDTAGGLNQSRTGVVQMRDNKLKDIVLGAVGGGVAGIPGAIGGMAVRGMAESFSSRRAARLLLNPDFTKWLRQTPNSTSPQVINRHFERLTQAASKEPVFAADVRALQQYLTDAFSNPSGMKAAAGEQVDDGRPEPKQQ